MIPPNNVVSPLGCMALIAAVVVVTVAFSGDTGVVVQARFGLPTRPLDEFELCGFALYLHSLV